MEIQLCTALCVLLSICLVVGEIHRISPDPVTLDTPDNSCPPEGEAVRTNISNNLTDILLEIAAENTVIPACGGSGWRQVAFLNMTNPHQTCPQAWRLYDQDSVRACGRLISNTYSCDSVEYSSNGYEFTQVCGRIIGYQFASPDGISAGFGYHDIYVDGVSLTYGVPRRHIWTFYAGWREGEFGCCYSMYSVVSQVGENYFCDTGNPDAFPWLNTFFTDHPLWDGIPNCPSNNDTCCAPHSGPWFYVNLTSPTTDSIEIRICGDQSSYDEDTPLELIEIYVK